MDAKTNQGTEAGSAEEMREYMAAQVARIYADWQADGEVVAVGEYAVAWIAKNAVVFRQSWHPAAVEA
jgi:hypothetical protein